MDKLELFFSYSEECEISANYEKLESISDVLECFEGATKELRRKGTCALYKQFFEQYLEPKELFQNNLILTSKSIVDQGGLSLLFHHFFFLASQLKFERELILEQELRMLLNILYAILVTLPTEYLQSEISQDSMIIEETLVSLIKLSTECSYIPMKKVSMLFERYLKMILDNPKKHTYVQGDIKNDIPRYRIQSTSVESFYVIFI